jgi:hypothetical protein
MGTAASATTKTGCHGSLNIAESGVKHQAIKLIKGIHSS